MKFEAQEDYSEGGCGLNIAGVAPWEWLCGRRSAKADMVHLEHEDMLTSGM
jgi:hypothetical protein